MLGDRSRHGAALSTASTVVVLAALAAAFLLAPGSAQVRHTFFNPTDMWRSFVGDPKAGYYSVGEALWLNIRMFVAAEVLILIVALAVAVVRQSTGPVLLPLRVVATVYVDVARGVPLILIIFALGYGLPALQLAGISSQYRTAAPLSWRYLNGRCRIFKVDGFRELVHFNGQDRFVVEGCARAAVRIDGIEDGLHHFFRLQSATTLYNFLHALRAELFTGGV